MPVVVGARSAVFAPTPHLGLIVLDEEHEASFKQDTAPRYHARDVALERARAEGVPLVLGSATPSLESWQRAPAGRVSAASRCRGACSTGRCRRSRTIDLRSEMSGGLVARGAISRPLRRAMDEALREGGQVILLLNRRGFSTHIQCPACGVVVPLPALRHRADAPPPEGNRDLPLLRLRSRRRRPRARSAASRASATAAWARSGWRRKCEARFPGVPCLRMDTDTMQAAGQPRAGAWPRFARARCGFCWARR